MSKQNHYLSLKIRGKNYLRKIELLYILVKNKTSKSTQCVFLKVKVAQSRPNSL